MSTFIECSYPPKHEHEYPDDWEFSSNGHPGADARLQPSSYTYYDSDAQVLHVTSVPLCDDEALDKFTQVADWFPNCHPTWLAVKRPGEKLAMLPFTYDRDTDYLTEVVRNG